MQRTSRLFVMLAAAALIADSACAGSPGSAGTPTPEVRAQIDGGFVAQYLGSYTWTPCSKNDSGRFMFRGSGRAEYLRESTESGALTGKLSGRTCLWNGTATLAGVRHSASSITFALKLKDQNGLGPCSNGITFAVKHGTGKLSRGTGDGALLFACTGTRRGVAIDSWSGSLTL